MARDAAEVSPRLIDDENLLPRDNSGGVGFSPYTAQFGDGGRTTGFKAHLSPGGGNSKRSGKDAD